MFLRSSRVSFLRSRLTVPFARSQCTDTGRDLSHFGNILGGEKINQECLETLRVWHKAVSSAHSSTVSINELGEELSNHINEKCVFHPPTYFKAWEGRDEFLVIISCVSEVFGKSFTYHRQWISPDGKDWALEFTANIGNSNLTISGIDVVKLGDDGKIIDFAVLARPPNAVAELKSQMMKKATPKLMKLKAKQAASKLFG